MANLLEERIETAPLATRPKSKDVRRFSTMLISEHWLVMIIFVGLVVTGIPQRFPESSIAQFMVRNMGGIDITRWIHRIMGFMFAGLAVWHLTHVLYGILFRRRTPYMIPTSKDFRDVVTTLRYYLRLSEEYPRFDRYDFRQKFEYFGMLMGGMVMISTGFFLFAPVFFTKFLPAFLIPIAKTIHGYEAMLALSIILLWHTYGAHMNPDVFPFDSSIFTGKISRERMHHEHPMELERIEMAEEIKDEEIRV
jgi:formate dehydrogenase subunit gamma